VTPRFFEHVLRLDLPAPRFILRAFMKPVVCALLLLLIALERDGFAQAESPAPAAAAKTPASDPADPEIPFPADIPIPPATVLTAEETLATFKLPPGLKIELVASEPMISTPVAMQFDADGRLWVVEMNGYMPNVDGKGEDIQNGRIVILEDTDNDGRMDKSIVFLDQLVMPRAIGLRKGGALVAVPPVLYWCPDTNGDGKADEQVPLVPTYAAGGNPEHMPNGLLLALDNWIYNSKSNRRFRFRQSGEFRNETTLFRGQWGICQDNFGRLFYNYNSDQLRADLLPSAYLTRNPNFKNPPGINDQIAKSQKVFPGRVTPGVNRGYRKGMLRDGKLIEFTAAAGPLVYRGDLLPEEFRGNAFVPETSANLIKRNILTENDGDIMARDAYEKTEFLTSTSERFRPVNLYDGPDGAIYVTDIARGIVQHITYVTPWLRRQILERNLEQPLTQGRIWRIVPEGATRRPTPKLSGASIAECIAQLSNTNGWVRDTAQRLLVERADPAAVPLLEKAIQTASDPLARLHALWTLDGMEKLQPPIITTALGDSYPKVRAAAIRLLEPFVKGDNDAGADPIFKMLEDPSVDVQLQLLLTLGELKSPRAEESMVKLLARLSENRLARTAVISGLRGREIKFLTLLGGAPEWREESSGRRHVIAQLGRCLLEGRQPTQITGALDLVTAGKLDAPWKQIALLNGVSGIVPLAEPPPDSIAAAQARIGAKPQAAPGLPQSFKPLKVAMEPPQLAALQTLSDASVLQAAGKVNAIFAWPGKPGYVEEKKPPPLTAAQKKFVESGKQLYLLICAACHQPTGLGQEGLAPPLAASDWAEGPENRLARIVLQGVGGPLSVNGKEYSLDMPGLGQVLNDEQIAQILSFVRRDLGNEAPVVSTAAVKKVRDATKDRGASWTADELQQIN